MGAAPRLAPLIAVAALLGACIAPVDIAGAPCPCPDDHQCCPTLGNVCVAFDVVCPVSHPPSTVEPCVRDADCEQGELCQVWTLPDGSSGGPGECRRACSPANPCAAGEACKPTLHDALILDPTHVAFACVSATPPAGCEGLDCSRCTSDQIGRTRCANDTVMGCFTALHPSCGLVCQDVEIEYCGRVGCTEGTQGAECQPVLGPTWCDDYGCDEVCGGAEPGSLVCGADGLMACTALAVSGTQCGGPCTCEQICVTEIVADSCQR